MKTLLASVALLGALLAVPAYASQCPGDMAAIDAALQAGPTVSAAQVAEVTKLRAEGEKLHKAGKHGESIATLGKAKAILGIQ